MKNRLLQYCESKGIAPTAFEKKAHWSPSTIYNLNKGIRSDKLAEAAIAFPDLDIRWLLTGERTNNETSLPKHESPVQVPFVNVEHIQAVNIGNMHELTERLDRLIDVVKSLKK